MGVFVIDSVLLQMLQSHTNNGFRRRLRSLLLEALISFVTAGRASLSTPQSMYDRLAKETNARVKDVSALLYYRYEFAVMAAHELVHAARNCLMGKADAEPCFGDSPMAEIGFELESRLSDGHLTTLYEEDPELRLYRHGRKQSSLTGALVLWE